MTERVLKTVRIGETDDAPTFQVPFTDKDIERYASGIVELKPVVEMLQESINVFETGSTPDDETASSVAAMLKNGISLFVGESGYDKIVSYLCAGHNPNECNILLSQVLSGFSNLLSEHLENTSTKEQCMRGAEDYAAAQLVIRQNSN